MGGALARRSPRQVGPRSFVKMRARFWKWVSPAIGAITEITRRDLDELVQTPDAAVRRGPSAADGMRGSWGWYASATTKRCTSSRSASTRDPRLRASSSTRWRRGRCRKKTGRGSVTT